MGFLDRVLGDLMHDTGGRSARRLLRRVGTRKLLLAGGVAAADALLNPSTGAPRGSGYGFTKGTAPPATSTPPPAVPAGGLPPVPGLSTAPGLPHGSARPLSASAGESPAGRAQTAPTGSVPPPPDSPHLRSPSTSPHLQGGSPISPDLQGGSPSAAPDQAASPTPDATYPEATPPETPPSQAPPPVAGVGTSSPVAWGSADGEEVPTPSTTAPRRPAADAPMDALGGAPADAAADTAPEDAADPLELPPDLTFAAVRTMIAAALSDGHLDPEERTAVEGRLAEADLSPEEVERIHKDLVLPASVRELAALAQDDSERDLLYQLAVAVTAADGQMLAPERDWLRGLASAFGLEDERASGLESDVLSELRAEV